MSVFTSVRNSRILRFVGKTVLATTVVLTLMFVFFLSAVFAMIALAASLTNGIDGIEDPLSTNTKYILKNIEGKDTSSNKILNIKINGIILASIDEGSGFFDLVNDQITYGYEIKDILIKAAENKDIKAVIIEVNSPGGTVNGSQAIYDGIKYYKEKTGKPVFTHIQGMGASGAVWSTVGSNKIFADVGSFIGSIGVISGPFKYYNKVLSEQGSFLSEGIVTQNGIETTTITAGQYKDFGNPYRQMSPEELNTMQKSLDNTYEDFVNLVSKERSIPQTKIKNEIKALIYDNSQARDFNLIDGTDNREEVIDKLLEELKISKDDFQIIRMRPKQGRLETLLEITTSYTRGLRAGSTGLSGSVPGLAGCISHNRIMAYFGDIQNICR